MIPLTNPDKKSIESIFNKSFDPISQKIDNLINDIRTKYINDIRQPSFRIERSYEYVGGKRVIIGIPKKNKLHYHGSSYILECDSNLKCNISGMHVTDKDKANNIVDELKILECDILDIHHYDSPNVKSFHIHFKCDNKNIENVDKIMKYLME